ncbi:MAG: ParB/RepB/Spo0J family partition protein [Clostridiales bacterium]|nr:ParB/RepB/Spo0J family partition protein [Clostridiales bacterium]
MKTERKLSLKSYEDIFSTEEMRQDDKREKVMDLSVSDLHPFKNHPFKVLDDDKMRDTVQSIREHGVLVPVLVRPQPDGGYEIVSGHRRHRACLLAGIETIPAIVREMDDDAAILVMVDSNMQRESILPSERAWAYRMKYEALKRQGGRSDLTSSQLGTKFQRADEIIAEQAGSSRNQIQRLIRLTHLVPALLDMVDIKKVAFNPAVELSYLKPDEQTNLLDAIESEQSTPSLSQAQRMKKFSAEGSLTLDMMRAILSEEKKPVRRQVVINLEELKDKIPPNYTDEQIQQVLVKLFTQWAQKQNKQQER